MNEGVKYLLSKLKIGKVFLVLMSCESFCERGEKSTWIDAVEVELDFFNKKRLSSISFDCSDSPLFNYSIYCNKNIIEILKLFTLKCEFLFINLSQ